MDGWRDGGSVDGWRDDGFKKLKVIVVSPSVGQAVRCGESSLS